MSLLNYTHLNESDIIVSDFCLISDFVNYKEDSEQNSKQNSKVVLEDPCSHEVKIKDKVVGEFSAIEIGKLYKRNNLEPPEHFKLPETYLEDLKEKALTELKPIDESKFEEEYRSKNREEYINKSENLIRNALAIIGERQPNKKRQSEYYDLLQDLVENKVKISITFENTHLPTINDYFPNKFAFKLPKGDFITKDSDVLIGKCEPNYYSKKCSHYIYCKKPILMEKEEIIKFCDKNNISKSPHFSDIICEKVKKSKWKSFRQLYKLTSKNLDRVTNSYRDNCERYVKKLTHTQKKNFIKSRPATIYIYDPNNGLWYTITEREGNVKRRTLYCESDNESDDNESECDNNECENNNDNSEVVYAKDSNKKDNIKEKTTITIGKCFAEKEHPIYRACLHTVRINGEEKGLKSGIEIYKLYKENDLRIPEHIYSKYKNHIEIIDWFKNKIDEFKSEIDNSKEEREECTFGAQAICSNCGGSDALNCTC